MSSTSNTAGSRFAADTETLGALISSLQQHGYRVIGPTVRDGAIVCDELETLEDMPVGWTAEQAPGSYRLKRAPGRALFGYAVGPHTWKRYLHPAEVRLFQVERDGRGFQIRDGGAAGSPPKYAFFGVRPCELAAIAIQDRVLAGDQYVDPTYRQRRDGAVLIAVQCGQPSASCFCASMGTGPGVKGAFDLALTEVVDGGRPFYVIETGSELGSGLLAEVGAKEASEEQVRQAEAVVHGAASRMSRQIDTTGIRELLYENFEHPRWDDVASRCLCCANCTLVCPTCFCSTVEDTSNVAGSQAERWRRWDSCFVQSFSYIHGGSVRMSAKSRYRQRLTHKLASWIDQFGASGCVGCGRCITWCPAGIDITEEVAAIRGEAAAAIAEGDRRHEGNQPD